MHSSELILNKDGSLYHLNLKPGDLSDLIITVGDPDRVGKVSQCFDNVELRKGAREFITHTGYLGKRRISVISTGIGTDNVDIVLNELHALHQLSASKYYSAPHLSFVRLGTSGTVRDDIAVDTTLISRYALGLDNLLKFYRWETMSAELIELLNSDERWRQLPVPYPTEADGELLKHFSSIADNEGTTLTSPGFYAPQGRSVNLTPKVFDLVALLAKSSFANTPITNIEMETAGIYGLAELLGHKAISISAILANRVTGKFSPNPERTVKSLIKDALEVIESL